MSPEKRGRLDLVPPPAAPPRGARSLGALALGLAAALALGAWLGRLPAGAAVPPPDRWGGPLVPAPLVSRGKRVASWPAGGEVLVDGVYRTSAAWCGGHPTPERPAWVAIEVGGGHDRLLLSFTSSGNHDWADQVHGAPADYRIETSADSRDGEDGHWRTALAVTGNPVRARAHAVDFHHQRWVRLVVTRLPAPMNRWGLFLDEIDVHDLSRGGTDSWVFLGDSITSAVFDRAPAHQPSFAAAVAARHPGYFPAMISAGQGSLHHRDALRLVDEVLALVPEARVVVLGFGSNDGDPAAFRADLVEAVRRVRAAGRIAVVPRIPFRPGSPVDYPARLNAVVDEVTATLGLLPGPDLYGWFAAHPEQLKDGLHPDDRGAVEMSRLWAEAVAPLYPGAGTSPLARTEYTEVRPAARGWRPPPPACYMARP